MSSYNFTEENIVNSLSINFWWKDKSGRYLGCNQAFLDTLGLVSKDEVIGRTDFELPWAETAETLVANDKMVMKTGEIYQCEEVVRGKQGKEFIFLITKAPLRDDKGETIGTIGSSVDITERKKLEEDLIAERADKEAAEAANKAQTEFLASISHDFRTPLNGIMGMAQVLSMQPHSHEQKEYINAINESANILLTFVQDLLSFTQIEADKVVVNPQPVDLLNMMEQMLQVLGKQIQDKGVKLYVCYPYNLPRQIITDPSLVKRIILNLVGNAIKFTPAGHIIVEVSEKFREGNISTLLIQVKDTGIGIPEDKLEQIFERFARVKLTYQESRYQGAGLGLSIVSSFVELLSGEISVESTVDEGSTFTCTLPCELQQEMNDEVVSKELPTDLSLAVVSDDEISKALLRKQLQGRSCDIMSSEELFNNIRSSESYLEENFNHDMVIIDIDVKTGTPIAFASTLRKRHPNPQLKVLLHTDTLPLERTQAMLSSGFDKVILKPTLPTELFSTLFDVMNIVPQDITAPQQYLNHEQLRILLVEDNQVAQLACKAMWEMLGCHVEIVSTAKRALAMNLAEYHIVLMDIGLPDKDGVTLTKEIRARDNEIDKQIPIIALTGNATEEYKQACLEAGMDGFLTKPASFHDFREVLLIMSRKARGIN